MTTTKRKPKTNKEKWASRRTPRVRALLTVEDAQLRDAYRDRAMRALQYLDDAALAAANPNQLAVISGICLDKARLLEGLPTMITQEQRMSLVDVGPALLTELKKRGALVEGEFKDVTPKGGDAS